MNNSLSAKACANICMNKLFEGIVKDRSRIYFCPFCRQSNPPVEFETGSTRMKRHLLRHTLEEFNTYFGEDYGYSFRMACKEADSSAKNSNLQNLSKLTGVLLDTKSKSVDYDLALKYIALFCVTHDIPQSYFTDDSFYNIIRCIHPDFPKITDTIMQKAVDALYLIVNKCVNRYVNEATDVYVSYNVTKILNNQKKQNIYVFADRHRFFYGLYDFSQTNENASSLGHMQNDIIKHIGKSKVRGIVSDSCPANITSSENGNSLYNDCFFQSCAVYEADLLLKDILKSKFKIEDEHPVISPQIIQQQIQDCAVYFRKTDVRQLYAEMNQQDLDHTSLSELQNDTIWYSLEQSATWLQKNYKYCVNYINTIDDTTFIDLPTIQKDTLIIRQYFNNTKFNLSLQNIANVLTESRSFIEHLENENCYISDVYPLYCKFCQNLEKNEYKSLMEGVIQNHKTYFESDFLEFAYTLDPRIQTDISATCLAASHNYIKDHYSSMSRVLKDELSDFIENREGHSKDLKEDFSLEVSAPSDYWKHFSKPIHLKSIAMHILQCPAFIANNESIWSFLKLINISKRSHLSEKNFYKLLYIRTNLKSLENGKDYIFVKLLKEHKNNDVTEINPNTQDRSSESNGTQRYQTYDDQIDKLCSNDSMDSCPLFDNILGEI